MSAALPPPMSDADREAVFRSQAAALLRAWSVDIKRKDALLRQALEAMQEYFDPDLDGIVAAITNELAK